MIDCMIGRSILLSFVHEIVRDWPIFLAGILSVIVAPSVQAGIDPLTAYLATSPGGWIPLPSSRQPATSTSAS